MKRRAAAILATLALLAACGDGSGEEETTAGGEQSLSSDEVTTTLAVPGETTVTTRAGGAAGAVAPEPSPGFAPQPTPTAPATRPNPSGPPALGGPGGYARFFLQERASAKIILELSSQDGAPVDPAARDHISAVLSSVAKKPVSIDGGGHLAGSGRSWTADQLRRLADDTARTAQSTGAAVMRILYLHGDFDGNPNVLAVTVRSDVIAMFVDQIASAATPLVSRRAVETAVLTHEVGHVLGLVDLVLDTGREDPDHPGHSRNPDSVMYWAVESTLVGQLFSGPPPDDFDNDDLRDLETIRTR